MLAAFRAAGFKSASVSHQDHPLLDLIASKLNEKDPNYISDELIALYSAAPIGETAGKVDSCEDHLLSQLFPDVKQSALDVSSMSDQNKGGSVELLAWLDEQPCEEELEEQLKQLAEERASIRAQMQEIQLLESQFSASSAPRSNDHEAQELSNTLSVEKAAVASLDAAVQERASKLTWTMKEISEASRSQNTRLWLILTDSPERESYLREEVKMIEGVAKQLLSVEARGTKGLSEVKPVIQLAPEDNNKAFKNLSSFDPSAASGSDLADQPLDASEIQSLLSEGARLRDCMKEAEAAYVESKLDAAQHAAELSTLRALISQQGNAQVPSLMMTRAERDWLAQLQDEASMLEVEEERIVSTALSQVLEDLGKLQDAHLLTVSDVRLKYIPHVL